MLPEQLGVHSLFNINPSWVRVTVISILANPLHLVLFKSHSRETQPGSLSIAQAGRQLSDRFLSDSVDSFCSWQFAAEEGNRFQFWIHTGSGSQHCFLWSSHPRPLIDKLEKHYCDLHSWVGSGNAHDLSWLWLLMISIPILRTQPST
jgi:hypothetical protein